MDTITHGIVGALTGKALFAGRDVPAGAANGGAARALSSPTARVAIVACTLGSMFPDIDMFAGPLAHNPLAIHGVAPQYHAFCGHPSHLGASVGRSFHSACSPGEVGRAAVLDPLFDLCGGHCHAHFSRSGHKFWDYGLEPSALLPPRVGLDFHYRPDADRYCTRAAAGRVVLSRTGKILAASRSAFGPC